MENNAEHAQTEPLEELTRIWLQAGYIRPGQRRMLLAHHGLIPGETPASLRKQGLLATLIAVGIGLVAAAILVYLASDINPVSQQIQSLIASALFLVCSVVGFELSRRAGGRLVGLTLMAIATMFGSFALANILDSRAYGSNQLAGNWMIYAGLSSIGFAYLAASPAHLAYAIGLLAIIFLDGYPHPEWGAGLALTAVGAAVWSLSLFHRGSERLRSLEAVYTNGGLLVTGGALFSTSVNWGPGQPILSISLWAAAAGLTVTLIGVAFAFRSRHASRHDRQFSAAASLLAAACVGMLLWLSTVPNPSDYLGSPVYPHVLFALLLASLFVLAQGWLQGKNNLIGWGLVGTALSSVTLALDGATRQGDQRVILLGFAGLSILSIALIVARRRAGTISEAR